MNLLLNRYRLLKLIGNGGFCKTYLAVDEGEFPPVPCVVQLLFNDKQKPEAFKQKTSWLQELGQHPQIPALLAHFQEQEHFYLVQEFIPGTNLATLLADEGPFSETQIWQLLENVLPIIKFIHDRQIIHRDIKPENLIYRSLSHPEAMCDLVLVDLGAAKLANPIDQLIGEPSSGNYGGNLEYMAPELALGKGVFASDLYSLGVTCIHLLTQISPFDLFDVANDCWVWEHYLTTRVSDRLSQILNKLIENRLSLRFQSVDQVIAAIGIKNKQQSTDKSTHKSTPQSPGIIADKYLRPSAPISSSKFSLGNSGWQCIHTLSGSASINSLAFSPDGCILASGCEDKIIRLWDLKTKKVIRNLFGHSQGVKSVAFSPDGQILATASDDQTIKLWDLNTFQEIFTLLGHSHAVKSVAFSPDGQILASGSWDKTVKIWDIKTGKEIYTLTGHKLQVSSVAFSPQGQVLASASFDRTIRLWQLPVTEVGNGNLPKDGLNSNREEWKKPPHYTLLGTFSGHTWAVLTVAFSPDGKILATGSDDKTVKLWDVNTGEIITTVSSHSWAVVAVAFSADGETLISGSWDQKIKLWQVSTAEEIASLCAHVDSVFAIAVSPVAQLIASGSRDKAIKLWQLVEQQRR